MTRLGWILRHLIRRLWIRASLIGALGIVAALAATGADAVIPWKLPYSISAPAIGHLLNIIASSMLTVATFSLTTMTTAYNSASNNVTPRAARMLMSDTVAQNVLSTFVGAFIFSIVGLTVLDTNAYGNRGRVVLFAVTVIVIGLVVVSLLRWIDYLTGLGRTAATTRRVEQVTEKAMRERLREPYLGGRPLRHEMPAYCTGISAEQVGYVQFIDMDALSKCAGSLDTELFVRALPGTFVHEDAVLAGAAFLPEDRYDEAAEKIRSAFGIADLRSFDQDPRFGLAVLSEIALRALSPAMNDPGTAIDVIGRQARLLTLWARGTVEISEDDIRHPRVNVPALSSADLFEDAFLLIARDGAAMVEVQLRLQKNLAALCRVGDPAFREAALAHARLALGRAERALASEADKNRLRQVAGYVSTS